MVLHPHNTDIHHPSPKAVADLDRIEPEGLLHILVSSDANRNPGNTSFAFPLTKIVSQPREAVNPADPSPLIAVLGPSVRGPKGDKHEAWGMVAGFGKDSFPANGQLLRCGTMAPGEQETQRAIACASYS
jgi:hypothetical protein